MTATFWLPQFYQSSRFKNSGKYGSGLSCRLTLFTAWAFGFKLHLIFHRVEWKKNSLILYLADFHGRNWRIPSCMRTRRNIEPYSPLKPTKLSFVFIGPNSLSRAEDLPAVNHVTQSVVRVGSKIIDWVVFKELRLEPKFLNRGLWIWIWRANYEPKPAKNLIFPPKHESQMWSLKLYNK